MRIQLLCLMQLEIHKLHFWLLQDTFHTRTHIYFSFTLFFHNSLTALSCSLKHISFAFIPLMTCFSSQVDFTSCGGLLCIAAVLLMIIGIVTAIVLSFQYVSLLWSSHLIYSVYSCFSAWGTAAPKGVSVWLISHSGAFLMSLNRSPGCICSTLQLEPSFTLWWVHTDTNLDRVFLLGIMSLLLKSKRGISSPYTPNT